MKCKKGYKKVLGALIADDWLVGWLVFMAYQPL